jgi:hypothetical protein
MSQMGTPNVGPSKALAELIDLLPIRSKIWLVKRLLDSQYIASFIINKE